MINACILVINPGSTSTKIAVYRGTNLLFLKDVQHSLEALKPFGSIINQLSYRKKILLDQLKLAKIDIEKIEAIVGRGGLVKPISSGVYEVNEEMRNDLLQSPFGEHASNLGGLIAADIASKLKNVKAYIADPVVVDEFEPSARVSGHPLFERKSIFHALNQKAVARAHAKSIMRKYEELNLIVVHLGGGITVGAHCKGKVIDVNQGLDGDGPFSPERSGTLPVGDLAAVCFSGQYSLDQIRKMIKGEGGLCAYLKTNSAYEVELKAREGDELALSLFKAMAYQVAKEIGAMSTVLKGNVDAILITGGIARSKFFVNEISERVYRIAPLHIYPGEDEMKALAMNTLSVLSGDMQASEYS